MLPSAIALLKETNIDIPLIIVSGTIGEETAVECMRLGAQDYIMKNNLSRLCPAIARELEEAKVRNKQKQAEKRSRESEETLHALINAATDSVILLDTRGVILNLNKIAAERLGKSRDELIGTYADDALSEDIAKMRRSIISQILETGRAVRFEDQRDGIWFDTIAYPITDKDGAVNKLAIIARDITERKRLEEVLKKEREELKLIIDSSPIIVFYKDKEGRFLRVNRTFAAALNMPEENFVGKTAFDLYSPQIAQSMTDDDQEVFQSRRSKLNIIEQYESASGIRWVQTDKIPIFDKDGIPIGLIGFAQDITERKQAEEDAAEKRGKISQYSGKYRRSLL